MPREDHNVRSRKQGRSSSKLPRKREQIWALHLIAEELPHDIIQWGHPLLSLS
jgi:hypothetical protein